MKFFTNLITSPKQVLELKWRQPASFPALSNLLFSDHCIFDAI